MVMRLGSAGTNSRFSRASVSCSRIIATPYPPLHLQGRGTAEGGGGASLAICADTLRLSKSAPLGDCPACRLHEIAASGLLAPQPTRLCECPAAGWNQARGPTHRPRSQGKSHG